MKCAPSGSFMDQIYREQWRGRELTVISLLQLKAAVDRKLNSYKLHTSLFNSVQPPLSFIPPVNALCKSKCLQFRWKGFSPVKLGLREKMTSCFHLE